VCCRRTRADITSRDLAPLRACSDAIRSTGNSVWIVCDKPRAMRASVRLVCDEGPPLRQEDTHQWMSHTAYHDAEESLARTVARVGVADRTPILASMQPTLPRRRLFKLCQDESHLSTRRQCALRGGPKQTRAECSLEHDRVLTPDLQNRTRCCSARAVFEVPHSGSAECASRPCPRSRRTAPNKD
jgi:hypothetical protein